MIRRRFLLGALLAAPVIVRTPGLLMAIKPAVVPARSFPLPPLRSEGVDIELYRDLVVGWEAARATIPDGFFVTDQFADDGAAIERHRLLLELHRREVEIVAAVCSA